MVEGPFRGGSIGHPPDPLSNQPVRPERLPDEEFHPAPKMSAQDHDERLDDMHTEAPEVIEAFKPSRGLYIAFATLAVIALMVALDGTSLSVALPVSPPV